MNILNVCVNTLKLNKPPYIPIPFSSAFICMLLYAKKAAKKKVLITILENNIDLSRLIVRALETNKNINNNVNNIFYYYLNVSPLNCFQVNLLKELLLRNVQNIKLY